MVDELITLGSRRGWGQTNANSVALLALRDYIVRGERPPVTAKFTWNTGISKLSILYDNKESGSIRKFWNLPRAGNLQLADNPQNKVFYLKFQQSYLPLDLGDKAEARQHGFVVKRELIHISKTETPDTKVWLDEPGTVHTFKPGDIVEEHIRVVNPGQRYFVAVSAPFAACFEFMNPTLLTSGSDAVPTGKITDPGDYQAYLDDRVSFYFDDMPAGTFDFYYRLRATTEGQFSHPPAEAELMYEQDVRGNSPGARIVIAAD
ncbi:MAG: hypothetical protein GY869_19385 [Planctomycetes bacterium]|nr:hypothetical protein [Planctomycetota bacterium]